MPGLLHTMQTLQTLPWSTYALFVLLYAPQGPCLTRRALVSLSFQQRQSRRFVPCCSHWFRAREPTGTEATGEPLARYEALRLRVDWYACSLVSQEYASASTTAQVMAPE